MEWVLELTAISMDDSETLLRILPAMLVRNGSWILLRTMSPEGVVHLRFEFEREACVDIYAALLAAGLDLDRISHSQLTQLCHCSTSLDHGCSRGRGDNNAESRRSFEPVRVDLEVVPEQAGVFELKPERGSSGFAHRTRT